MAGLTRSPTILFVDAFQGISASDASPAAPKSPRSRIQRKDITLMLFRQAAVELRAGHNYGRTVARTQDCKWYVGHARYSGWGRPYVQITLRRYGTEKI